MKKLLYLNQFFKYANLLLLAVNIFLAVLGVELASWTLVGCGVFGTICSLIGYSSAEASIKNINSYL